MRNRITKGWRLAVVVIVLLPVVLTVQAQGEPTADIPYIHYFDFIHNGLIIERADGTDSRMIPDLLPADHDRIAWHGWSPSGEWLAFSSYAWSRRGANTQALQVVRTDGQERIDLGAMLNPEVSWSPDTDILLVFGVTELHGQITLLMLDLATGEKLVDIVFDGDEYLLDTASSYWSDNGDAYIYWIGVNWNLITLSHDGAVQIAAYDVNADWFYRMFSFSQGRLVYIYGDYYREEPFALILEEVESGRRVEIADREGRTPYLSSTYVWRWSPSRDYALIYARPCDDGSCEAWLKLVTWETGTITDISPAIWFDNDCRFTDNYACREMWSPAEDFAILKDKDGTVYLLDVAAGETQQLAAAGELNRYQWLPDDRLVYSSENYSAAYIYDPQTEQNTAVPWRTGSNGRFNLSPDEQYYGAGSSIFDRQGSPVSKLIMHSYGTGASAQPWNYVWHPDSEWVMANYLIIIAGGGGPPAALLVNLDGTVRRELPVDSAPGYVPDRVLPHLAPGQAASLKPDPIFILPQEGPVTAVGWHPTDLNQLVAYSYDSGFVFWSLAGEAPTITRQLPPLPFWTSYPHNLHWLPESDTVYVKTVDELQQFDPETAEWYPVNDFSYPMHGKNEDGTTFIQTENGGIITLASGELPNYRWFLNSARDGWVVLSPEPLNDTTDAYYVDGLTGVITPFEESPDWWTHIANDAANGIAALSGIYIPTITIVDVTTGTIMDEFYGTGISLALSPDGRRLATTSAGMVAIWDMAAYVDAAAND
jgi:hypothetical protein